VTKSRAIPTTMNKNYYLAVAVIVAMATVSSTQENSGYAEASAEVTMLLQLGKDQSACADMAKTLEDQVSSSVDQANKALDALDDGSSCPDTGQEAVKAARSNKGDTDVKLSDANAAASAAAAADVDFGSYSLKSLSEKQCSQFFTDGAYVAAKEAAAAASQAQTQAAAFATAAAGALEDAVKAAADAVVSCQCGARVVYDAAWTAANAENAANEVAWRKAKHMQCVLAGTAPTDCTVSECPKPNPITLFAGLTLAQAEECKTIVSPPTTAQPTPPPPSPTPDPTPSPTPDPTPTTSAPTDMTGKVSPHQDPSHWPKLYCPVDNDPCACSGPDPSTAMIDGHHYYPWDIEKGKKTWMTCTSHSLAIDQVITRSDSILGARASKDSWFKDHCVGNVVTWCPESCNPRCVAKRTGVPLDKIPPIAGVKNSHQAIRKARLVICARQLEHKDICDHMDKASAKPADKCQGLETTCPDTCHQCCKKGMCCDDYGDWISCNRAKKGFVPPSWV